MPYKDINKKREFQRLWVAKRRAEYLQSHGPCKCGSWDNLEIDHIDPSQKVSHRIWSYGATKRDKELSKCQVLCRKCHMEKTIPYLREIRLAERKNKPQHGVFGYRRLGCRCEVCREAFSQRRKTWPSRQRKSATGLPGIADGLVSNTMNLECAIHS